MLDVADSVDDVLHQGAAPRQIGEKRWRLIASCGVAEKLAHRERQRFGRHRLGTIDLLRRRVASTGFGGDLDDQLRTDARTNGIDRGSIILRFQAMPALEVADMQMKKRSAGRDAFGGATG